MIVFGAFYLDLPQGSSQPPVRWRNIGNQVDEYLICDHLELHPYIFLHGCTQATQFLLWTINYATERLGTKLLHSQCSAQRFVHQQEYHRYSLELVLQQRNLKGSPRYEVNA